MRPEIAQLFGEGRNYPTLATTMDDGAPHAVSIWSGVEGHRVGEPFPVRHGTVYVVEVTHEEFDELPFRHEA